MERRKFMRFPVSLKVEAIKKNKESLFGLIRDFSREGLRVIFDNFDFKSNSYVDFKIQRPDTEVFVPASVEVIWKRPVEGRWETGLRFKEFPPRVKAEILEFGYKKWLKDKLYFSQY